MRHAPVKDAAKFRAKHQLRFVTATSLFDGHDAAINIMRRIMQAMGAEVIHLGHDRSVEEIVSAAVQEDVHGVAVTSYQGGHTEFFKYMVDELADRGAGEVKIFGGGGGVITVEEIAKLHDYGVCRLYSPGDGQELGLEGMVADMLSRADVDLAVDIPTDIASLTVGDERALARVITGLEAGVLDAGLQKAIHERAAETSVPVLGITGTGGAGKSSLTDEIVRRFRHQRENLSIAVLAVDPSKRKSGGALLGDRIRMNAIYSDGVYVRSLATRRSEREIAAALPDAVAAVKAVGYDLVIVETAGIGQGDAAVVPLVDVSLYVMTPEFGAASQLEKIDMLDFADMVAINKFDRRGADDALRDVRKQVQRGREAFDQAPEDMPVYGTVASHFNDDGVTALYQGICAAISARGFEGWPEGDATVPKTSSAATAIVPAERQRYLAEVAGSVRAYHRDTDAQATLARERQQLREAGRMLGEAGGDDGGLKDLIAARENDLSGASKSLLESWPEVRQAYTSPDLAGARTTRTSLSGSEVPKVAVPDFEDEGALLAWLRRENMPGRFPFTAGVFAFKRENEAPTRMFAGEGDPFRTNERFKMLSKDSEAKRLSTAFDSVTLYGCDPDERPDIYGKVGNSGVSIATLDDLKALYDGFDLCDPSTSVSMTINGPAPAILAMFINAAVDQQVAKFEAEHGRAPDEKERLAVSAHAHENVRGTVQADILKEDQGQNTCIFSTEFALRMMGDIQAYFIDHKVRNFYSVSISGYHIAEAGANPISQLAFTLANGFTFVEAYLARGMKIDDFAPNLSFFFSNGMDPEYTVLGRVARRIWSVAMRDLYGAGERSQKLKYHIQTSGRSLHAQEMDFNDIRTTLQALIAVYDNCNSLHTNAHDEAFTTPTAGSVRRALAIQMIINQEWGLAMNENPNQGSFVVEQLTDLVEEAVLKEFESISERGGVLGAMETGYQRGKIQDESLCYEERKHDGSLPIVGVNTFLNPNPDAAPQPALLQRSTGEEKDNQIKRLKVFHKKNLDAAAPLLEELAQTAAAGGNTFAVLMRAVRHCSLGQISDALYEVGGQYRRNM